MAYSTSTYPYDSVVYLIVTLSDGSVLQGSGAIIGPHTILTASHVVWDATDDSKITQIKIYPGYNAGGGALSTTWIAHFNAVDDTNDELTQAQSQSDFAVIDVAADLSAYGSFGVSANYAGGTVHVTGYPASASGVQTDQTGTVSADKNYSVLDYGSVATSPGASGGPIWVNTGTAANPDDQVVGLVSTSGWGVQLTSADLATIQSWENSDAYLWSGTVASQPQTLSFGSSTVLVSPEYGTYTIVGSTGVVHTAIYYLSVSQFNIAETTSGTVTVNLNTAVSLAPQLDTTLINVQQAQFTDYTVVFDLHSSQDKLVYELYQAAYDRVPDNAGFRYWATLADATGMSALKLADDFLASAEFSQKYGAAPTNTQYVTELYANVLGRTPDAAGLAYWVAQANGGVAHDQLLVDFATSTENVQLVGAHTANGYWTT